MARFFVGASYDLGQIASLSKEDSYHIKRVLRLGQGDILTLCDGQGYDYRAAIESITNDNLLCKILDKERSVGEPDTKLVLYQGLPKSTKMDLIVQKTVELGVHRIVPLISERVVVKLSSDKDAKKKQERWQRIAMEAAKQSGRGIIPSIHMPMTFKEAVSKEVPGSSEGSLKLILWEEEKQISLRSILDKHGKASNISIIIGPEGGLSEKELALAKEHGWLSASIGPRLLRTETAGMAVIAAIMYRMEEMEWK